MRAAARVHAGVPVRRLAGRALLAALLALAACARVRPLEGGAPDKTPPGLLRADPPDSSRNLTRKPRFQLDFSEKVTTSSVRSGVRFYPPVRLAHVERHGTRVRLEAADSLPRDTTVILVLGRGIQDLPQRDNKMADEVWLVYSTGPELRTSSVLGRVTAKGRPEPRVAVTWQPVPADTGRAALVRRYPTAAVNAEGLFRMAGLPPGRRFRLLAFVDANGNLLHDENELGEAHSETLQLAAGQVRRGLTWNIVDPNEPGQVSGVALNRSGISGSLALALRRIGPGSATPGGATGPGRGGAGTTSGPDTLAARDSVRADTLRPLPLPVPPRATSPWGAAYERLEPRGYVRGDWSLVYASPRGDYSVRVPPGEHALVAFVDVRRDSAPGLYVLPDSSALAWEPLWWDGTVRVDPGGKVRLRVLEIAPAGR